MSKPRRLTVLLVALFLFGIVPSATAQDSIQNPTESTPTTLYFHIFDTINRFVINTEPMDSSVFDVGGANWPTTPDFGFPIPGSGLPTGNGYDMNTVYGYSTAGPVEYDFIENGRPRIHPERGIAATVDIDQEADAVTYLYLDVRDAFGDHVLPSAMPQFTVEVTLQEGDNPGLDAQLDDGKDIMVGRQTFQLVSPDFRVSPKAIADGLFCQVFICGENGSPAPDVFTQDTATFNEAINGQGAGPIVFAAPGEDYILEAAIPMQILEPTIPKAEAYNVRIDWYQMGEVFGDDQFNQGWLRLASSPDHLPRLEFSITNPIYFSFIHPQVAGGSLLIHAGGNSPWGTYDVDLDAVTIDVTHESGKKVPADQLKKLLNSNEHVHGLHDEDAQMTFLWDFREHEADLGEYTIDMTLTNDANSAVATGSAKFIIEETQAIGIDTAGEVVEPTVDSTSDDVDTPSVGIIPVVALLGAALVIMNRRNNA